MLMISLCFSLIAQGFYCLPALLACFWILPAFTEMVWKMFPLGGEKKKNPDSMLTSINPELNVHILSFKASLTYKVTNRENN